MKAKLKSSRKSKPKIPASARTRKRAGKKAITRYALRLYITGQTPRSRQSVENLRALCDKYIPGQFDLEVVDIYQQPAMAAAGQVLAAPPLIKTMPRPLGRLVGNFSDQSRVIVALDIQRNRE